MRPRKSNIRDNLELIYKTGFELITIAKKMEINGLGEWWVNEEKH